MKALFFLRHYNDIDHITPIIDTWQRAGHDCDVVLIGYSDFAGDYRIEYLKSLQRVRVAYLRELLPRGEYLGWRMQTALVVTSLRGPVAGAVLERLARWYGPQRRRRLWARTARRLLERSFGDPGPGVVAFDWVERNSSIAGEWIGQVVAEARCRGLGVVSLPHGDSPHASQLIRRSELRLGPDPVFAAAAVFDRVAVPNELCAKRFRPFLDDSAIAVAGSPRYCDAWQARLAALAPASPLERSESRLKLVMFLRKRLFTSFWEEIGLVVRMIAAFDGVELVIKPHTRGGWQQSLTWDRQLRRLPNVHIAHGIHSGHLVEWADAVIDLATSVSFEAVKLGKPVLAADYLHAARSVVAEYMPETELRCRDDVQLKLEGLLHYGCRGFYVEANRQRFIREIIYAGDPDVLPRYRVLLEDVALTGARAAGRDATCHAGQASP